MQKRLFDFSDVHLYVITSIASGGAVLFGDGRGGVCGGRRRDSVAGQNSFVTGTVSIGERSSGHLRSTGTFFILNDRVDVALAADVDGVHVGQEDLPGAGGAGDDGPQETHWLFHPFHGPGLGRGGGWGRLHQLRAPCSPRRPNRITLPVGLELVKEYRQLVRTPFVAIGGIDLSNVAQAIAAGADRVAVVRAMAGASRCGPGRRKILRISYLKRRRNGRKRWRPGGPTS
jgi:hypothetical protein